MQVCRERAGCGCCAVSPVPRMSNGGVVTERVEAAPVAEGSCLFGRDGAGKQAELGGDTRTRLCRGRHCEQAIVNGSDGRTVGYRTQNMWRGCASNGKSESLQGTEKECTDLEHVQYQPVGISTRGRKGSSNTNAKQRQPHTQEGSGNPNRKPQLDSLKRVHTLRCDERLRRLTGLV